MKIVKHYWFVAIALITMISFSSCESDEERDLTFQDYTVRLGGVIWDLKTDMENLFTVTSHSPQVLSQIMVQVRKSAVTIMMNFIGYISLTGKFKTVGCIYIIQMVIHL